MRLFSRWRVFVDARVQGALLLRVIVYWFCSLLTVGLLLIYWKIIVGAPAPLRFDTLSEEHGTVVLASLIMLPVFLLDTVTMSNHFVGPFFRIRRSIHALASGAPMRFRKRDYWQDVAKDINQLSEYIEQLKAKAPGSAHQIASIQDEPQLESLAIQ